MAKEGRMPTTPRQIQGQRSWDHQAIKEKRGRHIKVSKNMQSFFILKGYGTFAYSFLRLRN
jgi:hypothetical protein